MLEKSAELILKLVELLLVKFWLLVSVLIVAFLAISSLEVQLEPALLDLMENTL
jgi:hypothetical protein